MPVKTPFPPVETLPGYEPGMQVSVEVQELFLLHPDKSVLYAPHGGPALAMPAKCAEHPGGIDGWLEEIYMRRDQTRRFDLIRKLKRAHAMEAETVVASHAARSGESKEAHKYSLTEIRDATGLPDMCMAAIAKLRGASWNKMYDNGPAYTTLLRQLYQSTNVDWVENPEVALDPDLVVEEVPREQSREQLGQQIDKALAYEGRCPECGREPAYIFQDRAYCSEAERVHHSQREKHGWDVHQVSPSERRRLEQQMSTWRRDPNKRFAHPVRSKAIQSPIVRAPEPVDLDALVAASQADREPGIPIDVETMPPAQLHTEEEPEFVQHLDEEVAEAVRENPEPFPQPQRDRPPYFRGFKVCFRGAPHQEHRWDTLEAPDKDGVRWPAEYRCPGVESIHSEPEEEEPGDFGIDEVTVEPNLPVETTPPVIPEPPAPSTKQDSYIDRLAAMVQDNLQADALQRMQRRLAKTS